MAIGTSYSGFQDDQAWIQVNFDDVALQVVSVVYQNNTIDRAIVNVVQGNKNDTFTALPGAGVPTPITQAIPNNRYTYTLGPKGILPNFSYTVSFEP